MRTSEELRRISSLALILKQERGDTEWSDRERSLVNIALDCLEMAGSRRSEDVPVNGDYL